MNLEEKITQLKDITLKNRDLIIDNLADLIEYHSMSSEEVASIVKFLSSFLLFEKDEMISESIFNLFAVVFCNYRQEYIEIIPQICLEHLSKIDLGSLSHALFIISESNVLNKKQIIAQYIASNNSYIKELSQTLIQTH